MRILLLNGPNLNKLGTREPEIYGTASLGDIERLVAERAASSSLEVRAFQANGEGELIDWLQREQSGAAGLIVNAGAYTHYSIAFRDAVAGCGLPVIEVHISNVYRREAFRHESLLAPVCNGTIVGLGVYGYALAVDALAQIISQGK